MPSTLQDQAKAVKKALLKKPLTASEIAQRAGYSEGRQISRALGYIVSNGDARVVAEGRQNRYAKA